MTDYVVFDSDDFGATHVISDQCQSRDCRAELMDLKEANPEFKATLFTIPNEMTPELLTWCMANKDWIELAVHGITHSSNYECDKMTLEEFNHYIRPLMPMINAFFVKGFKAPGWQISDGVYEWLKNNRWWVADQGYNDDRRPKGLKSYVIKDATSIHTHTWNCMGNGIQEMFNDLIPMVAEAKKFKFVSEVAK